MSENLTGCENYTRTPNAIFDTYLAAITSLCELKVVMAIVRKTYGWQKEQDSISLSQLEEITGLSREGVIQGVKKACKRGLVDRKASGQGYVYQLKIPVIGNEPSIKEVETSQRFRPATSQQSGLPSQLFGLEVVNDLDQQLVNDLDTQKKGLNKLKESSSTARLPKSEAVLIEEYFIKATTGSTGFMSASQREVCKKFAEEGMTVERCKPGIDQTIAEMNEKHKSVGSIQLCVPAIYQLDPAKPKPTPISSYQKPTPFEQPKKTFNPEEQKLTPIQQKILDEKRERYLAEEAEFAASKERRRLERLAQAQNLASVANEPVRLQA
jgi:phage replication O-like protein O